MPGADADKEVRGHVLIVAGSREMPGAVLLAATASLRAGAGKLTIATAASVAPQVGVALPEARVIGMAESAGWRPAGRRRRHAGAAQSLRARQRGADRTRHAGRHGQRGAGAVAAAALRPCAADPRRRRHAAAMRQHPDTRFDSPVLLTPHAGELAGLTGDDKHDILAHPEASARRAAQRWQAVVALKGAITAIAEPSGRLWRHEGGNTGLAISGSGDVLAGLIAGLAARGAALEQAASWGVALHAMAGEQLALHTGRWATWRARSAPKCRPCCAPWRP
jgi:ADP-dependent NAD(P)H-hydrate dehydratase